MDNTGHPITNNIYTKARTTWYKKENQPHHLVHSNQMLLCSMNLGLEVCIYVTNHLCKMGILWYKGTLSSTGIKSLAQMIYFLLKDMDYPCSTVETLNDMDEYVTQIQSYHCYHYQRQKHKTKQDKTMRMPYGIYRILIYNIKAWISLWI